MKTFLWASLAVTLVTASAMGQANNVGGIYQRSPAQGSIMAVNIGNSVLSPWSAVLSGRNNDILGTALADGVCVIAGGEDHRIFGGNTKHGTISGGQSNVIEGSRYSTISGGWESYIGGHSNMTIGGGYKNTNQQHNSTISGGYYQKILDTNNSVGQGDFIGGGASNTLSGGNYSAIISGFQNVILGVPANPSAGSVIVGGARNRHVSYYGFLGGGSDNTIDNGAGMFNPVIVGGANNTINGGGYAAIVAGLQNTSSGNQNFIGAGGGNTVVANLSAILTAQEASIPEATAGFALALAGYQSVINGAGFSYQTIINGQNNVISGDAATILNGVENWITSGGTYAVILGGNSNKITAAGSFVLGDNVTNITARTAEIGYGDTNKFSVDAATATARGAFVPGSGASVTLSADNQSVSTYARSYIRLQSDNVTAANRTFVLTQGATGQFLDIEWVGTNAGELVDDSAQTGAGNHRLSATWTPTQYDVLSLRFNGTDWVERTRSAN